MYFPELTWYIHYAFVSNIFISIICSGNTAVSTKNLNREMRLEVIIKEDDVKRNCQPNSSIYQLCDYVSNCWFFCKFVFFIPFLFFSRLFFNLIFFFLNLRFFFLFILQLTFIFFITHDFSVCWIYQCLYII